MAWFNRAETVRRDAEAINAATREARIVPSVSSRLVPTWDEMQSYRALWAMQVPAFNRGVRLISGTVAQLPLVEWDTYTGKKRTNTFLTAVSADAPYWVTMQRTVRDLLLHGQAYWQITAVDSAGYPKYARHIPFDDVTTSGDPATLNVKGTPFPVSDPVLDGTDVDRIIVFDGFRDGVLLTGLDTLTTAAAQVQAAGNYAASPTPTQILKNTSNYELSPTEVDELLAAYQKARQDSSVAYLNGGVELATFGYSAQESQHAELMNQSAIQIARLLNLDPFWVGAGVPGSALTYQNRVDMRQDLVDLTLSDYIAPIEQRLSMPDILTTRWKNRARFDTAEFLRSNLDTRSRMAIDLYTAGIITRDEARDFVSDQPSGGPA